MLAACDPQLRGATAAQRNADDHRVDGHCEAIVLSTAVLCTHDGIAALPVTAVGLLAVMQLMESTAGGVGQIKTARRNHFVAAKRYVSTAIEATRLIVGGPAAHKKYGGASGERHGTYDDRGRAADVNTLVQQVGASNSVDGYYGSFK